ncbi:hypothetical protein [Chryseobacterium gossypii]|uniref:hypothetical protein n=1 Tax=Chryseobacterium gossypii TaxID=3231602 RepID=UPI003525DBB6
MKEIVLTLVLGLTAFGCKKEPQVQINSTADTTAAIDNIRAGTIPVTPDTADTASKTNSISKKDSVKITE